MKRVCAEGMCKLWLFFIYFRHPSAQKVLLTLSEMMSLDVDIDSADCVLQERDIQAKFIVSFFH